MIVFDFDKTLINTDTLFGFYKAVHGNNYLFKVKRLLLIITAVIYKLKIINNDTLKRIGIALFLNGKSQEYIERKADKYVQSLKLNSIYYDIFLNCSKEKRVIISASPELYLKKLFPKENVIGTQLDFNSKGVALKLNCYKHKKLDRYNEYYSNIPIDAVYSDSYSDQPLFEKSKEYYITKGGKIISKHKNNDINFLQ